MPHKYLIIVPVYARGLGISWWTDRWFWPGTFKFVVVGGGGGGGAWYKEMKKGGNSTNNKQRQALKVFFNIVEAHLKKNWTLMSVLYDDIQMDQ